jgi:hypothetical protein
MKVAIRDIVEIETIDLVADETMQVEVQKELASPGTFKLYVHEGGRTIIRICKIKHENIQWVSNIPSIKTTRLSEVRAADPDMAKLEQQFKEAIGKLADYRRETVYNYIRALRGKIDQLYKENDELANEVVEMKEQLEKTDPGSSL